MTDDLVQILAIDVLEITIDGADGRIGEGLGDRLEDIGGCVDIISMEVTYYIAPGVLQAFAEGIVKAFIWFRHNSFSHGCWWPQ